MRKLLLGKYVCYLVFCLCFFFASCSKEEPTIVRINQEEFTPEEQLKIGEYLLEVSQQTDDLFNPLDPDQYLELHNYLNTLVEMLAYTELVENSRTFSWQVNVLQDDNYYSAFMLPGGSLFISTGLLKLVKNESELVALIAHEMMYADQGVVIEGLKEEFGGAILADVLLGNEITSEEGRALVQGIRQMTFTAEQVEEADAYAVQTICPFQYNATSMIDLLNRVEEYSTVETIAWKEGRPGELAERITQLLTAIEKCDTRNGDEYEERYQDMISTLP
ncbi:MAG: M48 family metalloprotease [Bacteroidota bacterium]